MEYLQGGRENAIYRIGDKVYRPKSAYSSSIHKLLEHLQSVDFKQAPKPFGFDENGNEILSYIDGDVYNYPLVGAIATEEALCSAARLLRQYHDATIPFLQKGEYKGLEWLIEPRNPQQVICHGDFAPYNVTLHGNSVVGIFDFDVAHPAPRVWDIAYAVYCWAPFKINENDVKGNITEQCLRAKLFCDCYGLANQERVSLVTVIIERIQFLLDFMIGQASKGNEAFIKNIEDNHHLNYMNDIDYLNNNNLLITELLF